ncbi:DUF4038 domain-containing protein [Leifsonia sp. NPDC058292]|uniref:apiosidase-like domain-containing protein n=1 Tax=Leifsonia sp. NPDC058292 TaxID=3346428 RepID=UPI0036DB7739
MSSPDRWATTEISFESDFDHERPYEDVAVEVTFDGPDGRRIRRTAFWDGGRIWRVRFAPTAVGTWIYTTAASDTSDSGLHSIGGQVECVANASAHGIYRHGFLHASPDGRHLQHVDGTPFFWLGDTHWRLAWERWDESNKPGWSSQFRGTVDRRAEQGFTVYQANAFSWTPPSFWDQLADADDFDVSFFQEVLDPRFAYIARRGLVLALGLSWYDAIDRAPTAMAKLARYFVARYGSYPMVWTLGGEVAGYEPQLRERRLAGWRDVALAIQESDDYCHPITAHLTNERPMPADYQDEDWLTFTLSQLGHGDLDMGSAHWRDQKDAHPGKPLVEGESFYEGLISMEPNGRRPVTDTMVRQVAYRAFQSGCCGYTYGAQGCWNGAWDSTEQGSTWGDLPWHEGVELPGGEQMGHLRKFYQSFEWTSLSPAPECFRTESWVNETFYPPMVSADAIRHTIVIFFGETYRPEEGAAYITDVPAGAYGFEWFDPRTGEFTPPEKRATEADGLLSIPPPPTAGDWLLLVRRTD